MHIGLIGGIGPAATDFYYRRLIRNFSEKKFALDLTIAHADTPTLIANQSGHQADDQADIFAGLTRRLANSGAQCVAVTSIAGHFCHNEFAARSVLPIIDLIASVDHAVSARGVKRIGILGTRLVMESRLYGGITGAEVIPPTIADRDVVHQAYVAMAASGVVTERQREIFSSAARRLIDDHRAEAIMLGGTDLALVFNEKDAPFPLIDCAAIHADSIAAFAFR